VVESCVLSVTLMVPILTDLYCMHCILNLIVIVSAGILQKWKIRLQFQGTYICMGITHKIVIRDSDYNQGSFKGREGDCIRILNMLLK